MGQSPERHRPIQAFKISRKLRLSIEAEFGFRLTAEEANELEGVTQETIYCRSSVLGLTNVNDYRSREVATEARHKRIAKAADKLLFDLKSDEDKGRGSGNLTSKKLRRGYGLSATTNAIAFRRSTVLDEVAPVLRYIKELAAEPHAFWQFREEEPPKRRRRKKVDHAGWDLLILTTIGFFQCRGIPPTANYIRKKRCYTSALLRGLEKLHDALPINIRAPSASALGSPAAEWIKKGNKEQRSKRP